MRYLPNTDEQRQEMLKRIGVQSFEELLKDIPSGIRLRKNMDLGQPLTEMEVKKHLRELACENLNPDDAISFIGAGIYDHYIPSAVNQIILRPEFYTAYTPYQAEVSQGTLQSIYEYQTMICGLTGMGVSNASMYDGGSAAAEAMLMAMALKKTKHVVCSAGVNPFSRAVIKTYLKCVKPDFRELELDQGFTNLDKLDKILDAGSTGAVMVQYPNFHGKLENLEDISRVVHAHDALLLVYTYPLALGLFEAPGAFDADVVAGDGQSLGNSPCFGGPTFGFLAAKDEFKRFLPGRLVGKTVDRDGKTGFVLTLQTREQHIRREKASSNICTNAALNALGAAVYMSLMGPEGLKDAAELCYHKAHYLKKKILGITGFHDPETGAFFNEFIVQTPVKASVVIQELLKHNIFAGIDMAKFEPGQGVNRLLIAVTEKRTKHELDYFVEKLSQFRKDLHQ